MKGHIARYDRKTKVGMIICDTKTYYFGEDDWKEENPPYIGCVVSFGTENSGDKKNPKVINLALIGEYFGPIGDPVKSRKVAIALSVLLGFLGGGRFYLGYKKLGVIQLVLSVVTLGFGAVWGFIDGVLLLMHRIVKDAEGRPLK